MAMEKENSNIWVGNKRPLDFTVSGLVDNADNLRTREVSEAMKAAENDSNKADSEKLKQIESNELLPTINGDVLDRCNSDSPGKYIGITKSARDSLGVQLGDKVAIEVDGVLLFFTVRLATSQVLAQEKAGDGTFKFNISVDYFDKLKGKKITLKKQSE